MPYHNYLYTIYQPYLYKVNFPIILEPYTTEYLYYYITKLQSITKKSLLVNYYYYLLKFNIDERQATGFIGLPTPANTLFIGSLVWLIFNGQAPEILENRLVLAGIGIVSSLMLVAPIPLLALKFKTFGFKENAIRYIFIAICILLLALFQVVAIPFIIVVYIGISVFQNSKEADL